MTNDQCVAMVVGVALIINSMVVAFATAIITKAIKILLTVLLSGLTIQVVVRNPPETTWNGLDPARVRD